MLKNVFCSIFLVVLCENIVGSCRSSPPPSPPPSPLPREVKPIPVPRFYRIDTDDYENVTLYWDPIPENKIDKEHPVLGIRAKLWPNEMIHLFYEKELGNEKKFMEKRENIRKNIHMEPETEPIVVTVGPNENSASAFGIKDCVHYLVKVQAFTDLGDGPYSQSFGFKILGKECERKKKESNESEGTLAESNNEKNVTEAPTTESDDILT